MKTVAVLLLCLVSFAQAGIVVNPTEKEALVTEITLAPTAHYRVEIARFIEKALNPEPAAITLEYRPQPFDIHIPVTELALNPEPAAVTLEYHPQPFEIHIPVTEDWQLWPVIPREIKWYQSIPPVPEKDGDP